MEPRPYSSSSSGSPLVGLPPLSPSTSRATTPQSPVRMGGGRGALNPPSSSSSRGGLVGRVGSPSASPTNRSLGSSPSSPIPSRLGTPQAEGRGGVGSVRTSRLGTPNAGGGRALTPDAGGGGGGKFLHATRNGGPVYTVDTSRSGTILRTQVTGRAMRRGGRHLSLYTVTWAVRAAVRLSSFMRAPARDAHNTYLGAHEEEEWTRASEGGDPLGVPASAADTYAGSDVNTSVVSSAAPPRPPSRALAAAIAAAQSAAAGTSVVPPPLIGGSNASFGGPSANMSEPAEVVVSLAPLAGAAAEESDEEEVHGKAMAAMYAEQLNNTVARGASDFYSDVDLALSYCDTDSNDDISERGGDTSRREGRSGSAGGRKGSDAYYPDPQEIDMLPLVLQQHILRKAQLVLSRFVFMFRLRKAIRIRHRELIVPNPDALPPALFQDSIIFRDWPKPAMAQLCAMSNTDHFGPRVMIHYYGQPMPRMLLLVEGAIYILDKKDHSRKPCNSRRNGNIIRVLKGPCVVNEALLYVDDSFQYAMETATKVKLIFVPPSRAEEVIASMLTMEQQASIFKRCIDLRKERVIRRTTPEVVGWSPLFKGLTPQQMVEVHRVLEVRSFMQGSTILSRRDDDNFVMFWVITGVVEGVGATRRKDQQHWTTKLFATFTKGSTVGEKSVYFKEPYLYNLVAKTHCDVLLLRAGALSMLGVMDREISRTVADGAFAVRGSDASVRLLLQCPRNMPPILMGLRDGLIGDSFVRDLQRLFKFRIVPTGEFIATKGNIIKSIIVIVSGTAHATISTMDSLVLPHNVAFGAHALSGAVWRQSIIAQTSCELWSLALGDYVQLARDGHVFNGLRERSVGLLAQATETDKDVLEVSTHRQIPELEVGGAAGSAGGLQHRSRELKPIRKAKTTFEIISSPVRPPIPPMDERALAQITRKGAKGRRSPSPSSRGGSPQGSGGTRGGTERSRGLTAYLLTSESPIRLGQTSGSFEHYTPLHRQQRAVTSHGSPMRLTSPAPSSIGARGPPPRARTAMNGIVTIGNYALPPVRTHSSASGNSPLSSTAHQHRRSSTPSLGGSFELSPMRDLYRRNVVSSGYGKRSSTSSTGHGGALALPLWSTKASPLASIGSLRDRHTTLQMADALSNRHGDEGGGPSSRRHSSLSLGLI